MKQRETETHAVPSAFLKPITIGGNGGFREWGLLSKYLGMWL